MALILLVKRELGYIAATFIVINWYVRNIDRPGKVQVGVLWPFAVALELPHSGYSNGYPFGCVCQLHGRLLVEVDRTLQR